MKAMELRRVDRELLDKARVAFRPTSVTPTTSIEQVMFDAGAIKVLDWLDREIAQGGKRTVGGIDETKLPDSEEGFLRRISKGAV